MSKYGKKGTAASSPEEAITKLREAEKMLNKKTKVLEGKIQQELKSAKANATTNKRAALQALKRKRRFTKQIEQYDKQLTNLEVQIDSLENSIVNKEVLGAMSAGTQALKASNEAMDPDYAHEVMDDLVEQNDIAREIQEIMGNPVGFNVDEDEEELEAELADLMTESVPPLPSVPTELPGELVAAQPEGAKGTKDLRKELAQLAL